MDETPKILVVGHVTHDRYGHQVLPGGCAYYGAQVYSRLGMDCCLATVVGEDFKCPGEFHLLDAYAEASGRTTVFKNEYPEDGPRQQYIEAQAPMVEPGDFLPELPDDYEPSVVHLAPVMEEVDLAAWLEAIDKRWDSRPLVAISVQGWIKTARDSETSDGQRPVVRQKWDVEPETLEGVDVACLSDEDLIEQGDLAERLIDNIPRVALTHGEKGSDIYVDGTPESVGAYDTKVVDPTGAGDVYAAGLITGLLMGEPTGAAALGASFASIVVEGKGPTSLCRLSFTKDVFERRDAVLETL